MSETPIWQVHRRPSRPVLLWSSFLACLFLSFSTMLIPLLMDGQWYWYLAGASIGCILALMLMHSIYAGAQCRVDPNGLCSYGFGKHDNLRFPLSAVRRWTYIQSGLLSGAGVDIDIEEIEMLHRKGLSISKMRSYQRHCGFPLVLEFLNQEDAKHLARISQDFAVQEQHDDSA